MHILRMSNFCFISGLVLLCSLGKSRIAAQCAGLATTPVAAADCAARTLPQDHVAAIDPNHPYTLAELIDIAERNNPRTRILWERARQRAEALGVEKSAYFPVLAGIAAFGDQRSISPFPKPLAPRGYTMVEIPVVEPEITLQYLIFDFGKREGRVDEAAAQKIAAGANFIAANQQVAFGAAAAYYAQERLEAAKATLKTAQTTQDASEDRALDYPGISTCVTTVFITGLSTTGAIKQKFVFRLAGSIIGGLIFGLGSTVFLFPNMDSITSLTVLIAVVAFISGWIAQGRQFSYVGLQIAFSFYLVAFEGPSAPTQLAPARDRLIGILVALFVMWIVFDQIWPVRTVSAMRHSLAVVLRDGAKLFRLPEAARRADVFKEADALRDQVGKTVADIRTMNDTVEYEFGVDREPHIHLGQTILRAALTAIALFWNQTVFLHNKRDRDLLIEPRLVDLRHKLAASMDDMANAVAQTRAFIASDPSQFVDASLFVNPRYKEYAQNALTRFRELQDYILDIDDPRQV